MRILYPRPGAHNNSSDLQFVLLIPEKAPLFPGYHELARWLWTSDSKALEISGRRDNSLTEAEREGTMFSREGTTHKRGHRVPTLENKGERNRRKAEQERSIAALEEALREPFQNLHWWCFPPSGS